MRTVYDIELWTFRKTKVTEELGHTFLSHRQAFSSVCNREAGMMV